MTVEDRHRNAQSKPIAVVTSPGHENNDPGDTTISKANV